MKAVLGAIGGAVAVAAMLVSYNLGHRQASSGLPMPAAQMVLGPDGIARPHLVPASQAAFAQPLTHQPYAWTPYSTYQPQPGYQPRETYPVRTMYVTERVATQPAPTRVSTRRVVSEEAPRRSWQKSALLIGGSAGTGAGVGALIGGKKGALAGAAIGGGAAAVYDQVKRH